MKPFLLITLFSVFIYSCGNQNEKRQIQELSKMIEKTDSLKRVLKQNKLDSVVAYQVAANSFMVRLKNNYKPTKVDMDFAHNVDEFKELHMLFIKEKEENKRTLTGEYGVVLNSLREETKTLNALKSDIENGRGDKKKYTEYIRFEQKKLNTIQGLLDHFLLRKKKYLPRFRKTLNELNDYMDKWEAENRVTKNE